MICKLAISQELNSYNLDVANAATSSKNILPNLENSARYI